MEDDTYAEARRTLSQIHAELKRACAKAAASLSVGLEDTLNLHRLGVDQTLRDHLKTTNIIENLNSILPHRSCSVKRWCSSDQRHRWWGHLHALRSSLQRIAPDLVQNLAIAQNATQ